ncbi:MAG: twin-arginine translocase TatA/TatE family subunit [Candidatus Acidiferrum sp.]
MLSMTHMIVVFVVALVVFGPQKLPELARGLGKLMAEFRKASTDFKSAFEQEMRDLDRQALEVQRRKAAEAAATSAGAAEQPATLAATAGGETATPGLDADTRATEALVVTPVAESVPRSEAAPPEPANGASAEPITESSAPLSHDQQQPV